MLDSLKFWKHEEPASLPTLGEPPSLSEFGSLGSYDAKEGITRPPSLEPVGPATITSGISPPIHPTSFASSQQNSDLQLISAKLDTIKAILDNLSARLARIEQMAEDASKEPVQQSKSSVRWQY